MSGQQHKLALPKGTVLQQYQIESVLGVGGFGIAYKAKHYVLGHFVVIKEYFPQWSATRNGNAVSPLNNDEAQAFEAEIDSFLQEAKQLFQCEDHPNISGYIDFFRENGTAYTVKRFEVGCELSDILKRHTMHNKPLSQLQIANIIVPVLEGLKSLHSQGLLHLDIKPSSIFVRKMDSVPMLTGFSIAEQDFSDSDKTQNLMYARGYAPVEQVSAHGEIGSWTDLYAVGATMWRIIANENPPVVSNRTVKFIRGESDPMLVKLDSLRGDYSPEFIDTIARAIAIWPENRFLEAQSFIDALTNERIINDPPPPTDELQRKNKIPREAHELTPATVVICAVLSCFALVYFFV